MAEHVVPPSRDDPVVAGASGWIGGPVGRRAGTGTRWWTPLRVALAVTCVVLALGAIADKPCHDRSWESRDDPAIWTSLCYSDVPFLYVERGLADGGLVYRDGPLEYPVLTGVAMQAAAVVAQQSVDPADSARTAAEANRFYELTAVLMALAALVAVAATGRTVPSRPWDAVLVGASPIMLMSATISWDLLAVAATSLAVLAWTRERPGWAGILIGVGAAVKLYPILLLGVVVLVALRAPDHRRTAAWRGVGVAWGTAAAAWAVLNVPVALWAWDGWLSFFTFNADRGADFGSLWYAVGIAWPGLLGADIDRLVVGAALVMLGLIVAVAVAAREPARLGQLAFLAVAAFVLVNKVWSPQYSLWLLALAVLARPRWRDLLIWQAAEVVYTVAVWLYLAGFFDPDATSVSAEVYAWSIALRVLALGWFCAVVVRDILRPDRDPVGRGSEPGPTADTGVTCRDTGVTCRDEDHR